ncbi:hypothetical protein EV126DRAFT_159815 [Verticillium dahliae]|nr:hypothetical protein EV126DRAFT_159815 [Verticillium dahliae]
MPCTRPCYFVSVTSLLLAFESYSSLSTSDTAFSRLQDDALHHGHINIRHRVLLSQAVPNQGTRPLVTFIDSLTDALLRFAVGCIRGVCVLHSCPLCFFPPSVLPVGCLLRR